MFNDLGYSKLYSYKEMDALLETLAIASVFLWTIVGLRFEKANVTEDLLLPFEFSMLSRFYFGLGWFGLVIAVKSRSIVSCFSDSTIVEAGEDTFDLIEFWCIVDLLSYRSSSLCEILPCLFDLLKLL